VLVSNVKEGSSGRDHTFCRIDADKEGCPRRRKKITNTQKPTKKNQEERLSCYESGCGAQKVGLVFLYTNIRTTVNSTVKHTKPLGQKAGKMKKRTWGEHDQKKPNIKGWRTLLQ